MFPLHIASCTPTVSLFSFRTSWMLSLPWSRNWGTTVTVSSWGGISFFLSPVLLVDTANLLIWCDLSFLYCGTIPPGMQITPAQFVVCSDSVLIIFSPVICYDAYYVHICTQQQIAQFSYLVFYTGCIDMRSTSAYAPNACFMYPLDLNPGDSELDIEHLDLNPGDLNPRRPSLLALLAFSPSVLSISPEYTILGQNTQFSSFQTKSTLYIHTGPLYNQKGQAEVQESNFTAGSFIPSHDKKRTQPWGWEFLLLMLFMKFI